MLAMMHPFAPLSSRPMASIRMHPIDMLDALAHDALAHHGHPAPNPHLSSTEDEHVITLTAPGVPASDVTVTVEEGRLRVAGTKQRKLLDYSLALPRDVDLDGAKAAVEDGLITVSLKKRRTTAAHVAIEAAMPPLSDDKDDAYTLTIVAAGFAAADLKIIVEDGSMLKVSGESKRTGARLERCVRLPRDADVDSIVAAHVDGILTVRAPTKPTAKPQSIRVNAAGADDEDMALAPTAVRSDKEQAAPPSADEDPTEEQERTTEMDGAEEAVMV